jgi:hypothetical protein
MRRTLCFVVALATLLGLAEPAAAEESEPSWPIHLACNATTLDAKPALHCAWDAYPGADAYRVVLAVRRRHAHVVRPRRVTETSFTRNVAPGRYNVVVRAVDDDHRRLARSNRVRVVVPRPSS